MMWPEFPPYVRPRISCKPYAGGRGTTGSGQHGMRRSTSCSVTRYSAYRSGTLAAPCVSCHNRAGQGMAQSGTEAAFSGPMIMQILVQWSGYCMLNRRAHTVRDEACTQPLAESGPSSMNDRTRGCARNRTLSESRVFPVLPVWMSRPRRRSTRGSHKA